MTEVKKEHVKQASCHRDAHVFVPPLQFGTSSHVYQLHSISVAKFFNFRNLQSPMCSCFYLCLIMMNRVKKWTWKISMSKKTCDCHGPMADEWRLTSQREVFHKVCTDKLNTQTKLQTNFVLTDFVLNCHYLLVCQGFKLTENII